MTAIAGGAAAAALGAIAGSAAALLLAPHVGRNSVGHALTATARVGAMHPATLDLGAFSLTLGASARVGVLTAVGAVLALLLHARFRS
jgi:hypothetical protein